MAEPIRIFSSSNGLNNKIDPVRLPYDPQTGVQDLAVAYNVDHDETGRISRRKGFAPTTRTEEVHSMFCEGGACLFVNGTKLYLLGADYSRQEVATVTQGAKMRYLQLGDRTYYANGFETGYIEDGINHAWSLGTYYGPDTDREFVGPPVGSRLAYHYGHIYVIQGSVAWHSEPYGLNLFDLARNFLPFESEIRMFRPVTNGIFVGLETNTIFIEGQLPQEMRRRLVCDYPAIEDTDVVIEASKVGGGDFYGPAALWTSTEGIMLGIQDGSAINLTQRRMEYPSALRGSAVLFADRYLSLLEP
jgi:hypothetical protein